MRHCGLAGPVPGFARPRGKLRESRDAQSAEPSLPSAAGVGSPVAGARQPANPGAFCRSTPAASGGPDCSIRLSIVLYDFAMFRMVVIVFMLLQPFQWVWSAVHVASDAASHRISPASQNPQESQKPTKALQTVSACSLFGDAASGHSCHDNHAHSIADLCTGTCMADFALVYVGQTSSGRESPLFDSTALTSIERPKWNTTR